MISKIEIYNPSFSLLATCFDFISCIWTTQYFAPGEFELVVEYSAENMTRLATGNYLVKNGGNEIGVIEKVRFNFSPDEGGTITASGRMAISLLDRRLIYRWNTATHRPYINTYCTKNQNMEEAARNAVYNQAINPSAGGAARVISGLTLGTQHGYTAKGRKHVSTYLNLYSALTSFLGARNLSHRIYFENDGLKYEVVKGTDRSNTMVFSRQRQNLLSFVYETDTTEYKNLAFIGGQGEGTDRFVTSTSVNGGGTGTNRREYFYGASSDREDNITDTDYSDILIAEAQQNCKELAIQKSVEAEIDLVGSGFEFGTDYNVGDIILIKDIVDFKPRITTVIESQSADGYTVNVEFNEDAPEEEEE